MAVAGEHFKLIVAPAIGHQVDGAVAGEIARHDSVRVGIGFRADRRSGGGMKTAAAVAEKDADERRLRVDDGEIGIAVVIEVGDREVVRLRTGVERGTGRRMKPTAAIVEQNGDGTVLQIGHNEVGAGIVIEVGGRHYGGVRTGGQDGLMER